MAQIDIELDEFDFDDLVTEVTDRLKLENKVSREWNSFQKKNLKLLYQQLSQALYNQVTPEYQSLAEEMKVEFLKEIQPKYTEFQLREMEAEYRLNHNI